MIIAQPLSETQPTKSVRARSATGPRLSRAMVPRNSRRSGDGLNRRPRPRSNVMIHRFDRVPATHRSVLKSSERAAPSQRHSHDRQTRRHTALSPADRPFGSRQKLGSPCFVNSIWNGASFTVRRVAASSVPCEQSAAAKAASIQDVKRGKCAVCQREGARSASAVIIARRTGSCFFSSDNRRGHPPGISPQNVPR